MRLDDAYSFQVISKTVKMVIPALIQVSCLDAAIIYSLIFTIFVEIFRFFCVLNFIMVKPANGHLLVLPSNMLNLVSLNDSSVAMKAF